jgi:dihydrodipicolinate synthase/N-acetylneuraminate lyase
MNLSGIITAAVTPLSSDGTSLANTSVFDTYYRFLIERGINGLLVGGTTGEGMILSLAERKNLAECAVTTLAHAVPIVIHAGCSSTAETVELARHAASVGADGVAVLTPYFYHYDQKSLAQHYITVANAVPDLPVFLYHLPEFAWNRITPELLDELLKTCPNIQGIKHSDSDMVLLQEYRRIAGDNFCLLSGDDSVEFAALSSGANGCISGKSSCFPELPVALYRAFSSGDYALARQIQHQINNLATVLDGPLGMGLAFFKAALLYRGINVGGMRAPMRELTSDERGDLVTGLGKLRQSGIITC